VLDNVREDYRAANGDTSWRHSDGWTRDARAGASVRGA